MRLPPPAGPVTEWLFAGLRQAPHDLGAPPPASDDTLSGDDFNLALYCRYELHYRGFDDVDDSWEWEPSLVAAGAHLERAFEERLREEVGSVPFVAPPDVPAWLMEATRPGPVPELSRYLESDASIEEICEVVVHRSAYQLKEADPHSWAIPRLSGPAKAALVEIQADEYGSGNAARMHSHLFARAMTSLGLDASYGAYLPVIPGLTLAGVNLMSLFGIHRKRRGEIVGHLAAFEMTSSDPNRRFGNGLRRLGYGGDATLFYDEHVEADSVHEVIAAHDMAGALARDDPAVVPGIIFGALCLFALDDRWADHVMASWRDGRSSLRTPVAVGL